VVKSSSQSQSFCDHSRNFAWRNSKFWRICKKCLRKLWEQLKPRNFTLFFAVWKWMWSNFHNYICTRFRNIFNSSSCWLINRVRLWCRWWQLYIVMKGFVCCCCRFSLHKCEENKGGEQLTNQCLAHTQDMLERKPFTDEIISYKCFKTRISPCKIPTVITESLVVYTRLNPY
jgi:hypothetical protein